VECGDNHGTALDAPDKLHSNPRLAHTQYASIIFTALLGLMWPLAFHNVAGLMNPWFTIFVDLDQVTTMYTLLPYDVRR
jgi:hypothetical protein